MRSIWIRFIQFEFFFEMFVRNRREEVGQTPIDIKLTFRVQGNNRTSNFYFDTFATLNMQALILVWTIGNLLEPN